QFGFRHRQMSAVVIDLQGEVRSVGQLAIPAGEQVMSRGFSRRDAGLADSVFIYVALHGDRTRVVGSGVEPKAALLHAPRIIRVTAIGQLGAIVFAVFAVNSEMNVRADLTAV